MYIYIFLSISPQIKRVLYNEEYLLFILLNGNV